MSVYDTKKVFLEEDLGSYIIRRELTEKSEKLSVESIVLERRKFYRLCLSREAITQAEFDKLDGKYKEALSDYWEKSGIRKQINEYVENLRTSRGEHQKAKGMRANPGEYRGRNGNFYTIRIGPGKNTFAGKIGKRR